MIAEAGADDVSIDDAFGDRFTALETAPGRRRSGRHSASIGFELKMFSLREIDLGETGEIIQSTLRADAELEREQAMVKVRQARLENDTAMGELAASIDGDVLLRYRQLESWRDILAALGRRPGDPVGAVGAARVGCGRAGGPAHAQ